MNKVLAFLLGIWILSSCSSSSDGTSENPSNLSVADSVYRPAYHYSPYRHWMGQPISLVSHGDQYHLFYQYNATDTDADVNSWGHATSSDMMRWNELSPLSVFEDYPQGSVVSDAMNSSLLGQNLMVVLVNDDEVNLFYSENGFNWTEYAENPVLKAAGTPKVTRNKEGNIWIMTLTDESNVTFFSSEDLIHWSQESQLTLNQPAASAELFAMGESWGLLLNSKKGVDVLLGEFDGSTFSPSQDAQPMDSGPDNTAGTVLSLQDRSVYIGWMNNMNYTEDLPTESWKSSLTLPRTLALNANNELTGFPVEEVNTTLTSERRGKIELLKNRSSNWYSFTAVTLSKEVEVSLFNEENEKFLITYSQSTFTIDRSESGFTDFHDDFSELASTEYSNLGDTIQFDIFIDHSSVEVFINQGQIQFSSLVFPKNPFRSLALKIDGETRNIPAAIYDIDMYED